MGRISLSAAFCLAATAAQAETGLAVDLPELRGLGQGEAEALLTEVVRAVVVAQNCADYAVSPGEWALLTGTGDLLTGPLGLDVTSYDALFWRPAFAALDQPDTCAREGRKLRPLISRLKEMGGNTEPL